LKELVPELPDGAALAERIDQDGWRKLERAMPGLKERAKTFVQLIASADYLFAKRPVPLDGDAKKLLDASGKATLAALIPRLEAVATWTPQALEAEVRNFAEDTGRTL